VTVERGDGWELRLGDCLDPERGLPSLGSCDHVITDPPYSRDLYKNFRSNSSARKARNGKLSNSYTALASESIGAADDIVAPASTEMLRASSRWVLAFHDAESGHMWREQFGEAYVRAGIWVKTNPMPQVSGDRPAQGFESFTLAHRSGRKRWNGGGRAAVYTCGALQSNWHERVNNNHPCPKPLSLMEALVRDFTDPGELICDPFAGSGTTGVACIRLGRRFIGWERDPKYFAIAVKRLRAAREQMTMFGDGRSAAGAGE
jgi:DNA modification methylase